MSFENVKKYFDEFGMGDRCVLQEHVSDTVEHAAQAIGCIPAQIAKTMSFLVAEEPIMIVMAGDAKVHNSKYKAFFHQKAAMIPWDQVEALTGHMPGGVCPFARNEGIKVYLDVSMKRFEIVYAAAGAPNGTIGLSIEELEKYSGYEQWVDIAKDWDETL
jgi:prolyl-tRNA editing enzyme YbaK/EbsC (Cys-tRNA(Pro) deacylase)